MRDCTILHDILENHCSSIHKKRLASLMVATQSLLDGQQLSLTELGRNIRGKVSAKHNIKRIDRLLGNASLYRERMTIYRWHAKLLCQSLPRPIILVDWADVREQTRYMTLRASLSFQGRSVILYERVFPFCQYNSPKSHSAFLQELASIVPASCRPIVVTDAGYRNPWFREVQSLGWHYVGRIRGEVRFRVHGQSEWVLNKTYYCQANHTPTYLGEGQLGRKSPIDAHLYLYKAKPRGRKDRRSVKAHNQHHKEKSYRTGSKEPWLLCTNLPAHVTGAKDIVRFYAKRMQIEESFRDMKSTQYGLGLRHSNSRCVKRYDIFMLLILLAEWVLRLIGIAAHKRDWQRDFQANTIRHRPVLSLIRLGREVRKRSQQYVIKPSEIRQALQDYLDSIQFNGDAKL